MFSNSYKEAKEKFCQLAAASGYHLKKQVLDNIVGLEGEELSIDIAVHANEKTKKLFIVNSGTHGVEGFYGSAAECAWLRDNPVESLPEDLGICFIHAANPYGFSHLRRFTQENVDLMRNFINFDEALPENPGYTDLEHAIIPEDWFSHWQQMNAYLTLITARLKDLIAHSKSHFVQPVAGGQYSHPDGLMYGGGQPTWSNQKIRENLRDLASLVPNVEEVAFIDLHTGLGKKGDIEAYIALADGSDEVVKSWLSHIVKVNVPPYEVKGPLPGIVPNYFPGKKVTSFGLEVGTESIWTVFNALRADGWLYKYGDPNGDYVNEIKLAMKNAFYPQDSKWQQQVLSTTMKIFAASIAGLNHEKVSAPQPSVGFFQRANMLERGKAKILDVVHAAKRQLG